MRRRRKVSFFRKHRLTLIAIAVGVLVLALGIPLVSSLVNPYGATLRKSGVKTEKIQWKKDVLTLTFEGDSVGILSCRSALNALREEKPPPTLQYVLVKDGNEILTGTVSRVGVKKSDLSPRVETLNDEMTLLKLAYELAQSGISAQGEFSPTQGLSGKTVTVTARVDRENLRSAATSIPAALEAVNEQGGGIVRCDVLFTEEEGVFASVSYDLVYGDTLYSSAFYED